MKKFSLIFNLILAVGFVIPTFAFAEDCRPGNPGCIHTIDLADSAVTSAKIADGTITGPDIGAHTIDYSNMGDSSVRTETITDGTITTADFADGAVTSAKILDGTVSDADIADGTVATADLADNAVTSSKIQDGAVSTVDIADNSVTNSKIPNNEITAAKIADGAGSGLDADMLDGLTSAEFAKKAAKEVIVASSGGDYSTISDALAAITDASAFNRYVIKVKPGIYSEAISMKSYVDIIGSGRNNTEITSSADNTVVCADNTMLKDITVSNIAGVGSSMSGDGPTAIRCENVSMAMENIKVNLLSTSSALSITFGIIIRGSADVNINNCIVDAKTGVGGGPSGKGQAAVAIWGDAKATITNCRVNVRDDYATPGMWNIGIANETGNGSYDLRDSVIKAVGGTYNTGIENYGNNVIASNVRIEAIGRPNSGWNHGVEGYNMTVTNSEIIASGSTNNNYAVKGSNSYSSCKIGSSLIDGGINIYPRIVNSWDGNFDPIANQ